MMKFSIVIPVWNGAEVIAQCLTAIASHQTDQPREIICVDNASRDDSAAIIAAQFPTVKLLRQPVNLGFAGGVNVGIRAAQGEAVVLLNQDCLPQAGWLSSLSAAFEQHAEFGVAGCTIYFSNGQLDHAGARLLRPSALGEHLTDVVDAPRVVDFVTGAAMAIRRSVFDAIGLFDEGFYPAYYEECDFCYRAREHGFQIAYVPAAKITHLRSSREAQADPIRIFANHQRARYRFVIKQFTAAEIDAFISFETAAAEQETDFNQAVARLLGARDTLRSLRDIIGRRQIDRGDELLTTTGRQLEVGLTMIVRRSFACAERIGAPDPSRAVHSQATGGFIGRLVNRFRGTARGGQSHESTQLDQRLAELQAEFERRLRLLEILTDYDYR